MGATDGCSCASLAHAYEVRPRKGLRGVDLMSDALPFGRLWVRRAKRNRIRSSYLVSFHCFGLSLMAHREISFLAVHLGSA
jgi:hypothetical protein